MTLTPEQIETVLSSLPDSPINRAAKTSLRVELQNRVHTTPNTAPMFARFRLAPVFVALLLIFGGLSVYSAGNAEVTRGSLLYPVKQATESAEGLFAFSALQEVRFHMDLAHERTQEVVTLVESRGSVAFASAAYAADGIDAAVSNTLADIDNETQAALDAGNRIQSLADALSASNVISAGVAENAETLQGLSDNAVEIIQELTDLVAELTQELENVQTLNVHLQALRTRGVEKVQLNFHAGTAEEDEDDESGSGSEADDDDDESGSGSETGSGSEVDSCTHQAEQRLEQAARAIDQAQGKIDLEAGKGSITTEAETLLDEARALLAEAQALFDAGDCAGAEAKAFEAKKRADEARQGNKFEKVKEEHGSEKEKQDKESSDDKVHGNGNAKKQK